MEIKNYNDLDSLELDILREIGNIGTSNAANALSQLVGREVRITLPEVRIMGYNDAIEWIGGAESITAGVLVHLGGEINGILLSVQQFDFVNLILSTMLEEEPIVSYSDLSTMEHSALVEVGNIMISSFINALSSLADISIKPSVPAFAIDMQGAILTVPMAAFGGQSDYIMTIGGNFICDQKQVPCKLLLSPDILSLNILLGKLTSHYGE